MSDYLTDPNTYFALISDALLKSLGEPEKLHQSSPLAYCESAMEVLIATILTQATSDRNALSSWRRFKQTFPEPESVLAAEESVLADAIRAGGLANQKAKTIRAIMQIIRDRIPGFSLEEADPEVVRELLQSLPGVGPKTAACVYLFGLDQPAFPVDTHIHRIATRIGWVNPGTVPQKTQQLLTSIIPPRYQAPLHILLLNLGRRYCRPHKPNCQECPLKQCCKQVL